MTVSGTDVIPSSAALCGSTTTTRSALALIIDAIHPSAQCASVACAILACVAKVRDDGGDACRTGATACVECHYQVDDVVVDRGEVE